MPYGHASRPVPILLTPNGTEHSEHAPQRHRQNVLPPSADAKGNKSRKEEICRELVQLVIENYTRERRAQFYADKLGISLQHLSTTVRQVTGRNVLDIIAHVVIVDVKAKLKSTNMTIQEIAYSLNFPSASFFGKYFKRHMGMSPLEYRNS